MPPPLPVFRVFRLLAVVLPVLLAACDKGTPGPADPAAAYPIRAELRTFALAIPLDRLNTEAQAPLPADFVQEYHRRGRGPMTIVLPDPPSPAVLEAARGLAGWLDARLIPAAAVTAAPGVPGAPQVNGGGAVAVFYKAHVAVVPECGDWSGENGYNPTNLPMTGFGCSYHRNIGLMLADPGDWIQAQPTAGMEPGRATAVIDAYRAGETTGAATPSQERGVFADVRAGSQ